MVTFDADLASAAERLIDSGRVSDVRVLQHGRVVTGIADAERVYIRCGGVLDAAQLAAKKNGGAPDVAAIDGECGCGAHSPCVHVAAVMIAALTTPSQPTAHTGRAPVSPIRPPEPAATRNAQARQQLCYLLETVPALDAVARLDTTTKGHLASKLHTAVELQLSLWVADGATDSRQIEPGARAFTWRNAGPDGEYPRYVDPHDRDILGALAAQRVDGPWALQGAAGFELLKRVVATGRALWQTPHGTTLRTGAARRMEPEWRLLPNGEQYLTCATAATLTPLLTVEPAAYVDTGAHECGALEGSHTPTLLRRYWNQPPSAPEQVAAVSEDIARHPDAGSFPRPRAVHVQREALASLQAALALSAGPAVTLGFVYNGTHIDSRSLSIGRTVRRLAREGADQREDEGACVYEIERDRSQESALLAQLEHALRQAPQAPQTAEAWLTFVTRGVPALEALGWQISIETGFPYRIVAADDWYADLKPNGRQEWFDLRLGVTVDGQPVNLLPALVAYLRSAGDTAAGGTATGMVAGAPRSECLFTAEHLFVPLEDGRYLPVAVERIRRIADTLVELFDQNGLNDQDSVTLPASQASRLAQLALEPDAPTLRSPDESLLTLIEQLKNFSGITPLGAPAQFPATLRPYQQEGLGWLQFLRSHRLGGILADDMGLGKTVQTLAHLATEKAQGRLIKPSLIVAPVSVIGNWQREIQRFTPELTQLTLRGARRQELYAGLRSADIVIIGYPLLLTDSAVLLAHDFCFVILDEAQSIKNPLAKVSQAVRKLRADHRLCLTGTPMENHLGELWSLFDFVQPGLLGDERQFQRQYRMPIEREHNGSRAQALRRRIQPFLLRRTKDAVAQDLPAKLQFVESIALEDAQRDFYDGIRLSAHARIREAIQMHGLERSRLTVLNALLKLRQACCDPRLVSGEAPTLGIPSAKLDWLSTALPELIAEGRRVLLFSQFTSMLRLIEAQLALLSIPYCLLTGATRDRTTVIDRFQSGSVPLFLISLKAGGTGLNLTAADTVIHYDPWWNPAAEAQATDRAHRIGQDKQVFVHRLIAQGTVEEKILQLQADKAALATQLYSDGNASPTQLTAADLESLLAP